MRLMTVSLHGYRKFVEATQVDVSGKIIALVGPNEAGKSSILDAMVWLNHTEPLSDSDRTYDAEVNTSVSIGYVLDDEDRDTLAREVWGAGDIRWWVLTKAESGEFTVKLYPQPSRRLTARHYLGEQLARLRQQKSLGIIPNGEHQLDIRLLLDQAIEILLSEKQDLANADFELLHSLSEAFDGVPTRAKGERQSKTEFSLSYTSRNIIDQVAKYDEPEHPCNRASEHLVYRRPIFLKFAEEDRDLSSRYDLRQVAHDPPKALANLARLADVDLVELLAAIADGDHRRRHAIVDRANELLRNAFHAAWTQSGVSVRLDPQRHILHILVSMPDSGGFTRLEDRSDGLRWFVALMAFMANHHVGESPILLVDEAETHLHYDAQADLVSVFTDQPLAAKIIYTTHSAGCLPRDLGTGVRLVVPLDEQRSTVSNSVWADNNVGVSPLVIGMGATIFAFLPARNVVFAEGASDAMLYPTLFREATDVENLSYQVVPGLAVAGQARLAGLPAEAGSVAYLIDGDVGGNSLRRQLVESGIDPNAIISLGDVYGTGTVLEDLVNARHYLIAVNQLLRDFQGSEISIGIRDLPEAGRPSAVEKWCHKHSLHPPDKCDVIQRLLDLKAEAARCGDGLDLLAKERKRKLGALHAQLMKQFNHI